MFEEAARKQFRFESPNGPVFMVEDLFVLPLSSRTGRPNLDDIAKGLHKQLKESQEVESFVSESKSVDDTLQTKFDIVLHVINVRKAEAAAAKAASDNKEKKQKILALIAQKQDQELMGKSLDDLRQMAEAL